MKKICLNILVALAFCIHANAQADFSLIGSRIRNQIFAEMNEQNALKNVVTFLPKMNTDGSWSDIDYKDTTIAKWKPSTHLDRLRSLAQGYVQENGFYHGNTDLGNAINRGLQYWLDQKPRSSNWWHNDIAVPQKLGEILVLLQPMKGAIADGLKNALVQRMIKGDVFKQTGANKLDIALHMIYRAVTTENAALMDTAVEQAFQPVMITNDEGIQHDFSYQQHGPQLQISSYGLVFLTGEYKVASWLKGTAYALKPEKLQVLNKYFINTFLPSIRGRYIDFNTEGRGISRKNILDKYKLAEPGKINSLIETAKMVSPENAAVLNAAMERISQTKSPSFGIKPSHTYFWKGEYTLHNRPSYSFNVRTVSKRTKRTEAGNKENLLGTFLPDGSTNIQRNGSEYYNLMPLWEWDKIPGVTNRDFATDPPMVAQWGEFGNTEFTGGVSDSLYGASCYVQDYNGVQAKKSWFFFDKEVLCLGSDINSKADENVTTSVNQTWLNGKVRILQGDKISDAKKVMEASSIAGLWHDSIGYVFLSASKVALSAQKQKGRWTTINSSQPNDDVEGEVFKLWIDHGKQPVDGNYAYAVLPGISANDVKNYKAADYFSVSNTAQYQAVYHKGLDMLQIVFYEKGTVEVNDFSVQVDKPCILIVKRPSTKNPVVHIADPLQKESTISVNLKSKILPTGASKTISLPQGNFAGSTVSFSY